MSFTETVAMLNLTLTIEQTRACRYLERIGQSFCVDFGYDNAIEKAREHWNARRRARYRSKR